MVSGGAYCGLLEVPSSFAATSWYKTHAAFLTEPAGSKCSAGYSVSTSGRSGRFCSALDSSGGQRLERLNFSAPLQGGGSLRLYRVL